MAIFSSLNVILFMSDSEIFTHLLDKNQGYSS